MTEYIYAIQSGDRAIKFGRAGSPQSRLNSMQTGNPDKLTIVNATSIYDMESAIVYEKMTHALLRPYRIKGEWFNVCPHTLSVAYTLNVADYIKMMVEHEIHLQVNMDSHSMEDAFPAWLNYWCTDFNFDNPRVDTGGLDWNCVYPIFSTDIFDSGSYINHAAYYSDNYRESMEVKRIEADRRRNK